MRLPRGLEVADRLVALLGLDPAAELAHVEVGLAQHLGDRVVRHRYVREDHHAHRRVHAAQLHEVVT